MKILDLAFGDSLVLVIVLLVLFWMVAVMSPRWAAVACVGVIGVLVLVRSMISSWGSSQRLLFGFLESLLEVFSMSLAVFNRSFV